MIYIIDGLIPTIWVVIWHIVDFPSCPGDDP